MLRERLDAFAHRLNSVHVYCRLVDWGVERQRARDISRHYEKFAHPIIYGLGGILVRIFG